MRGGNESSRAPKSADGSWIAFIAIAIACTLLLNPAGLIAGGQDDWHYLNAARCWERYGPCLPHDHWQARWPIVVPIAIFTSLLGESRLTISIAPLIASICSIILLGIIANRLFGRPTGWVAALLFTMVPAFTNELTQPSVESTELSLVFAGFLAALQWKKQPRAGWAFVSGLSFALAFQLRETSAVAMLFCLGYVVFSKPRPKWLDGLNALAGFSIPLIAEFATFWAATGDPFWRRELSIRHVQIPSTELLVPADSKRPPFFNLTYIAHWKREPGIYIHWSVDWFLNLLFSGYSGLSLLLIPTLLIFYRRELHGRSRSIALTLWILALVYCVVLTFALAIDPKARMMLVPLAITSTALGIIYHRLWALGKSTVVMALFAASIILLLPLQFGRERTEAIEGPAQRWIDALPQRLEIDDTTRFQLPLVRGADTLPSVGAEKEYLVLGTMQDCRDWIARSSLPQDALTVVDSAFVSRLHAVKSSLRASLCLFRFNRRLEGGRVRDAINITRAKDMYNSR